MKPVILCGGLGTRLREETEFRPKLTVRGVHTSVAANPRRARQSHA